MNKSSRAGKSYVHGDGGESSDGGDGGGRGSSMKDRGSRMDGEMMVTVLKKVLMEVT